MPSKERISAAFLTLTLFSGFGWLLLAVGARHGLPGILDWQVWERSFRLQCLQLWPIYSMSSNMDPFTPTKRYNIVLKDGTRMGFSAPIGVDKELLIADIVNMNRQAKYGHYLTKGRLQKIRRAFRVAWRHTVKRKKIEAELAEIAQLIRMEFWFDSP